MICGSCGMRMDGAAVLACKTRMYEIAQSGHVPVISAMGNLPIRQGPRRRHGAVLGQVQGGRPAPAAGLRGAARRQGAPRLAGADERDQQRVALHQLRSCVSECNSMASDPDFLGPQALAKAMRFVGDPRDAGEGRPSRAAQRQERHLAVHPLLLLQRALPEGRRPARRDREARAPSRSRRASTATWARSTRSGSSARRRRPAGCARQSSCRRRRASSSRSGRRASRSSSRASARCRRPSRRTSRRTSRRRAALLRPRCTSRVAAAIAGIVQGEKALAKLAHGYHEGERDPYGEGSFPRPLHRRASTSDAA